MGLIDSKLNLAKLILFFCHCQFLLAFGTVAPTWITSPYIQANRMKVINGDLCSCTTGNSSTPTSTMVFTSAFPSLPNLGYGISNYQGDDGLASEMVEVNRTSLTTTSFSVLVKISGFTHLWVVQVRYIAISKLFPHHLNSFDNVPVQYKNGALKNISVASTSVKTYSNSINYTLQAQSIGSSYTTFSTPLTNNKILLFLTSYFITGVYDVTGTKYPINLQVNASPTSTTTYLLTVSYSLKSALTRLHFSMIVFDEADVQSSGQYLLIYNKICYSSSGGFYPFEAQFLTNFMIGFAEFSSSKTQSVIHFSTNYVVVGGLHGALMPASTPRIITMPPLTRFCFTYFYMKTWVCPSLTFFNPDQNLCVTCPVANCLSCLNLTFCNACDANNGYFLNATTGLCETCGIPSCLNCSAHLACLGCLDGFVLNQQTGLCQSCDIPGCIKCLNSTACSQCNGTQNYILTSLTCTACPFNAFANISLQICQACTIAGCLVCSNLSSCQTCDLNNSYYLTSTLVCEYCNSTNNQFIDFQTFSCQPCILPNCFTCSSLTTCIECDQTTNQTYNLTNGQCYACEFLGCIDCFNWSVCTACDTNNGYILNETIGQCEQCPSHLFPNQSSHSCQPCAVDHCLNCSALDACRTCDTNNSFYRMNKSCFYCDPLLNNFINPNNFGCDKCMIQNCIRCINLTACTQCNQTADYFLNITDNRCKICNLSGCLKCQNLSSCYQCDASFGYILNQTSKLCNLCPLGLFPSPTFNSCSACPLEHCLFCSSSTKCKVCDTNNSYYLMGSSCYYCDPSLNYFMNYDTLSCEACSLQQCFNCSSPIACQMCNTQANYLLNTSDNLCYLCQLSECIQCKTFDICSICNTSSGYILNLTSGLCEIGVQAELISIQRSGCNQFKIIVKVLMYDLSYIFEKISFNNIGVNTVSISSLNDSLLEIEAVYFRDIVHQNIILNIYPGTFLNISYKPDIPALFYDDQQCEIQRKVQILLQVLQYISYAVFVASLFSNKIVGLQLFGVFQLAYFTLASHNFLNIYLSPLTKFRTFNGFNIQMITESTDLPVGFSRIGMSASFINNCNIMLFLLLGQFTVSVAAYIISKNIKNQKIQVWSLKCLKQCFLTLILFNIFNASFSAGVHWKYANPEDSGYIWSSFALYGTVLAMAIAAIAMEVAAKQNYGEFKNKFKDNIVCRAYIPLTLIYRMALGLYGSLHSDYEYSSLIILAFSLAFMMFIMINLPFAQTIQNYRSSLIHMTMLFTLLTTNYYRTMKSTTPFEIKGRIYAPAKIQLMLIISCIVVSFIVTALQIYKSIKEYCAKKRVSSKPKGTRQVTQQSFQRL